MAARLKIDIVVHGRFHAFELAEGLRANGHDVVLHTNYPANAAARFGVPAGQVRSFLRHAAFTRVIDRTGARGLQAAAEPYAHRMFGRWAARGVRPDADFVYGFSGVMEELLSVPAPHQMRFLLRGSAHIREQARLLEEEEKRAGVAIERPSPWMIAREEREYERADCVSVLSTFAYDSFVSQGFQAERLRSNPLGVSTEMFRAEAGTRAARAGRVRAGTPLRILTVGTFSYRKGILDLLSIAEALRDRMTFTFVGGLVPESAALQNAAAGKITLVDRAPQHELAQHYRAGDIFVFPTIEDGFAAVLLQAAAAGLPILATENCSAKDFIGKGGAGWVLPIRNPGAFIERLVWCDENRTAIAQMAEAPPVSFARNWSEMAAELVEQYHEIRAQDRRQSA